MSADEATRTLLEDKRAQLEADIAKVTEPPDGSSGISFGKRVGEGTSYAVERLVQVGIHDQMQAQLADVVRAVAKLDEGTYGTCDGCGSKIAEARLENHPWATLCVTCASEKGR